MNKAIFSPYSLPEGSAGVTCGICLEDGVKNLLVAHDPTHPFHNVCIKRWLQINPSCPTCRKPSELLVQQPLFGYHAEDIAILLVSLRGIATVGAVAGGTIGAINAALKQPAAEGKRLENLKTILKGTLEGAVIGVTTTSFLAEATTGGIIGLAKWSFSIAAATVTTNIVRSLANWILPKGLHPDSANSLLN